MNRSLSEVGGKQLAPPLKTGNIRWTICAMLFAATTINYMDRSVLSILKPTLEHSIGLTEISYSYIVDVFQICYALGLVLTGRLIDKVGTRVGYMAVMAAWSLSAMAHSLANSVLQFGICRACLGLGESGNFPAAGKTVAEWFPQKERSLAVGIFNSGANIGTVLALAIVPWVTIRFGWHYAFLVTGLFSAVWILVWYAKYRKPQEHPTLTGAELNYIYEDAAVEKGPAVPWGPLFGFRQTWAYTLAKGLTDPIWWFYLYWMPSFFNSRFHLDLKTLGLPIILVYSGSMVGSILGGWLPSLFLKLGFSQSAARMGAFSVCAFAVLPVFLVTQINSIWFAVALLSLATAGHQGWSANLLTLPSDLFPRAAVASVTGIGAAAGSIGGLILATYAGRILQLTGSYVSLFVIAAGVYLFSLVLIFALVPGLKKAELVA